MWPFLSTMRKILLRLYYCLFKRNLGCLHAYYGVSYLLLLLICSLVTARSLVVNVHSFAWWRQFHANRKGFPEEISFSKVLSESRLHFMASSSRPSSYDTASFLSPVRQTAVEVPPAISSSKGLGMTKSNFIDSDHVPMVTLTSNQDHHPVPIELKSRDCELDTKQVCPPSLTPEWCPHQADLEDKTETCTSWIKHNRHSNKKQSLYHTFRHPVANTTLYGYGISLRRFKSWVHYKLLETSSRQKSAIAMQKNDIMNFVSTEMIDPLGPIDKDRLRMKWIERKLIVDKTEVFSKCQNVEMENSSVCPEEEGSVTKKQDQEKIVLERRRKFEDLLKVYVQRLTDIIKDEVMVPFDLVEWLETFYDSEKVQQLKETNFRKLTFIEQKEAMMQLLRWFRTVFPYYYDECEHCGASYRTETTSGGTERNEVDGETMDLDTNNNNTLEEDPFPPGPFLGFCYPEPHEQLGRAARTEIFECRSCGGYTRFPRYNSVKHIVDNRRGRCGEYSILFYRMLRALGHEARWVVDWADHVWVECWMSDGQWIHLDPCEAALDRTLLYEEWGKKQLYIIAFWAPLRSGDEVSAVQNYISDVTLKYTSDDIDAISKRRKLEKEVVDDIVEKSISLLRHQLNNVLP